MNYKDGRYQGSHTERSNGYQPKRGTYQDNYGRNGHFSRIDSDSPKSNYVEDQKIKPFIYYERNRTHADNVEQPLQQQLERQKTPQKRPTLTRKLFEDPDFPHNEISLFGESGSEDSLLKFKEAKWLPLPPTYRLVVGKIESADVRQTYLEDCFFVAVICDLADKGRILELFETKQLNSEGRWRVICYYMGKKQVVELDNYFPYILDNHQMKTVTDTNGDESWVLLLEKAFAKMHRSYAAINGGAPTEAMRFVTGAPAESFLLSRIHHDADEEDKLWNLLTNHGADYLFTCGIGPNEEAKKMGLPDKHAYTILATFTDRYSGDRVLKLRNTWGRYLEDGYGEWKGKWSDYDRETWEEYVKKIPYEFRPGNDGVFHINYDDFLERFTSVEVCYLHRNFILQEAEENNSNFDEVKSFSLIVERVKTSFYIMVNQESHRKFSKHAGYEGFEYSEIAFNLVDSKFVGPKDKWLFPENVQGQEQQVWKKVSLLPGNYEIKVRVKWSKFALKHGINNFVVNTYGPRNVVLLGN